MFILYAFTKIAVATTTGIMADFLVRDHLKEIFSKLLGPSSAYQKFASYGIITISILVGGGLFSRQYDYDSRKTLLPEFPSSLDDFFIMLYNTSACAVIGIFSMLAVILFICLVQQIGLARAQIINEKR